MEHNNVKVVSSFSAEYRKKNVGNKEGKNETKKTHKDSKDRDKRTKRAAEDKKENSGRK
jgi:hypothetical protein